MTVSIEPKLMSAESLAEDRRYLERYGLDPCDIEYRLLAHIAAQEQRIAELESQAERLRGVEAGTGYWQVKHDDALADRDVALVRVKELEGMLSRLDDKYDEVLDVVNKCQHRAADLEAVDRASYPFWLKCAVQRMHEMVDQTNPNDPIGIALTRAGLEMKP